MPSSTPKPDLHSPDNPFALEGAPGRPGGSRGRDDFRLSGLPRIFLGQKLVLMVLGSIIAAASAHIVLTFAPREAAALFLALVGGIAVLVNPYLGIAAYFVLAFLRPQDVFWGFDNLRLTMLASIATGGAFAIHLMLRPRLDFLRRWETLWLLLLWASLYLSTQFGEFGSEEARWMGYYNKIFVIYFLVIGLANTTRRLTQLSWIIALSVGYLGVWANKQYFFSGVYVVGGPGHTLRDENDFAMFLVMSLPFMWFMMRSTKHLVLRAVLLGLMPATIHAVMLTYSRGGFLGLCATLAFVAVREKNKVLSTMAVLAGIIFWAAFAGQDYQDRIGSIDDYEEDGSATGRIESWETGSRMLAANPVFGVGLKRYVEAYPAYATKPGEKAREAHNSWVQLGAESGIFALLAYGMLIFAAFRSFRRIDRRTALLPEVAAERIRALSLAFQGALVGYLVCGFFLSMEDQEFFYLIIALSQLLDRTSADNLERHEAAAARAAMEADVGDEALPDPDEALAAHVPA
ncbi:putative O-glycosylation ligase, exosortase A system-associated [bacterium]|nr:putative O-glycosylation ligase, exosortase A system-associated [bacterium]